MTSPGLRSVALRQTACGCLLLTGASVCKTGERFWRICENCNKTDSISLLYFITMLSW
uniref:Uncharacterized protein n=1 Tax=Anguilla anguilla TaxID=7936 RepID=A0A0E9SBW8_ANGAN